MDESTVSELFWKGVEMELEKQAQPMAAQPPAPAAAGAPMNQAPAPAAPAPAPMPAEPMPVEPMPPQPAEYIPTGAELSVDPNLINLLLNWAMNEVQDPSDIPVMVSRMGQLSAALGRPLGAEDFEMLIGDLSGVAPMPEEEVEEEEVEEEGKEKKKGPPSTPKGDEDNAGPEMAKDEEGSVEKGASEAIAAPHVMDFAKRLQKAAVEYAQETV